MKHDDRSNRATRSVKDNAGYTRRDFGRVALAGRIEMGGPTVIMAVAELPRESVTWMTSVTLPTVPAT